MYYRSSPSPSSSSSFILRTLQAELLHICAADLYLHFLCGSTAPCCVKGRHGCRFDRPTVLGRPLRKHLSSVVSNRTWMKFGNNVLRVDRHRLKSPSFDLTIDVIISKRQPCRPFTQQGAVLPHRK